jgi:hypothetical protein
LIDFGDSPVFKAIAYPSVIVATKKFPDVYKDSGVKSSSGKVVMDKKGAGLLSSGSIIGEEGSDILSSERDIHALTVVSEEQLDRFEESFRSHAITMQQSDLNTDGWRIEDRVVLDLLEKIKRVGVPLEEYVDGKIYYGIKTGYNDAFVIDDDTRKQLIKEDKNSREVIKPFLRGRDIKRYAIEDPKLWLLFMRHGIEIKQYPAVEAHLKQFKHRLTPGVEGGRKPGTYKWYEIQDSIEFWKEFEKPKIVWGNLGAVASFTFTNETYYASAPACIIPIKDLYLLAVLNSKVGDYFFHKTAAVRQGGYLEYKPMYVSQLPIAKPSEIARHGIEEVVVKILTAKKKGAAIDTSVLEHEIDLLTYKLYGLTEEEISIVEGKS